MDNYDDAISNEVASVNTAGNFAQNLGDDVVSNDLLMDDIIQDMNETPN